MADRNPADGNPRDKGGQDLLQDLFSSSSEGRPEQDPEGVALSDLSTAGLFSSHNDAGEREAEAGARVPIEPPKSAREAMDTPVAARQGPVQDDVEKGPLAPESSPPAMHGDAQRTASIRAASQSRSAHDQPSASQSEPADGNPEETAGPSRPSWTVQGDVYPFSVKAFDWRLEKTSVGHQLVRKRRQIVYVLLGGATLAGMVGLAVMVLGPTPRQGQWSVVPNRIAFALSFALLLASLLALYSLSARVERALRSLLGQQGNELRAAQAVSAERQQALARAKIALSRHARNIDLGSQVGRLTGMGLSLDELMTHAVSLLQHQFGADYVGLYLLDEDRVHAELCAQVSTRPEPAPGLHQVTRVTDDVLLRQCVSSGRPRILQGVDQVGWPARGGSRSPLRHGIRSALALPLIARGMVFGVISVQSGSPAAFSGDDLAALRNAADQVASGISNAQLADRLSESLARLETLQERYVREAWDPSLAQSAPLLYEYHRPGIGSLGEGEPSVDEAGSMAVPYLSTPAVADPAAAALLVPIALRDQVLGVLGLHCDESDAPWTEEHLELLTAVSEQMGLVIENSWLFAEAQSHAARERQAREIVAGLRQSLDTEEILSTAAREIGETLGLKDVTIRLSGIVGRTEE
jgi:GAF domain-containing protein